MALRQIVDFAEKTEPGLLDAFLASESGDNAYRAVPFKSMTVERWSLDAFAGNDWDTRLDNALSELEPNGTLVIPSLDDNDWLVFEGNHVIDVSVATGRDITLENHARIQFRGTSGYWLTVQNTANVSTSPVQPRCVLRDLFLAPDPDHHWANTGGVRIQGAVGTLIDNPRIYRFGLAGINIHNYRTLEGINAWTEQTKIYRGCVAGNTINILGDQDTAVGAPVTYALSQRGTQILHTFLATLWNPGGEDWPTEASKSQTTERRYGLVIRDVSWYHGQIQVGLGLKRSYSTGILFDGGSFSGGFAHVEGEATISIDGVVTTGIYGVHVKTGPVGGNPYFARASGSINITAIPNEGGADEDEEDSAQPASTPLLDERTGIASSKAASFGDLRIGGTGFFNAPRPLLGTLHQIIPKDDAFGSANVTIGLSGVMDSDGNAVVDEYVIHDQSGGLRDWTRQYHYTADLSLLTDVYGVPNVPLAVQCSPYNEYIQTVTEFSEDAGRYYVSISETNPGVIRLGTTEAPVHTLHEIRGGRPGQVITIFSLDLAFSLVHSDGENGFQLAGQSDWITPHYYACRRLQYTYHSGVGGWFWADIGGAPGLSEEISIRTNMFSYTNVRDMYANPKTLIGAPDSGKGIILQDVLFWYDYSSTPYTVSGQEIEIKYADSNIVLASVAVTGFLDQSSDQVRHVYAAPGDDYAPQESKAIVCQMTGSAVTLGNSPLRFKARYRTVSLTW